MKDHFSRDSGNYARYRPTYPNELFKWLISQLKSRETCWDCGTGSGQVASALSAYFEKIYATDISQNQIFHAEKKDNIYYSITEAEQTNFLDNTFDFIIAAQAVHWFDHQKYFLEVKRTSKPGGIISLIGYSLMTINTVLDPTIESFYKDTIGPYWDFERKYIDEEYKTLPFPFHEIKAPHFEMNVHWSLDQLLGYIRTWSAVRHYIDINGVDPVKDLKKKLIQDWHHSLKKVSFPLLLRVGRV